MRDILDDKDVQSTVIHFWVVNRKTGEEKRVWAMSPIEAIWKCNWLSVDCEAHLVSEVNV